MQAMTGLRRGLGVGLVALLLAGAGCVTAGKYERLQKKHADYVAADEAKALEQQAQIDELTRTLLAERDKCAAEEASLQKQLDALNAEKIALVMDKTRLTVASKELENALADAQKRKAAADARIQEFRDLLARFKSLIDSGKLKVRIVDGKMVVELATDVLFASGSATLSAEGKTAVTEVAGILKTIGDKQFQIAGHTDNVPIRTAQYRSNWDLAFDRAHSVLKTMIDAGMPANHISAASYAEFQPRAGNSDDAGRAQNRRIEIIVVPDLSQLPGAEELQNLDKTN